MKSRSQIYRNEAATLLRDLTTYHHIRHNQILKLYPGKESKIENLLSYFVKQGRIFYDQHRDIYHDGIEASPDHAMLAAIWVLLDFIDKVEYHSVVDFPACLLFLAEGDLYEIFFIPEEKEILYTQAISQEGGENGKRIVIVENVHQIDRLSIPGVTAYCTVDIATGAIQYYRREVSCG